MRNIENHQCPAYHPYIHKRSQSGNDVGLVQGIQSRGDAEYARELVALLPNDVEKKIWSPDGWCERPKVDLFVSFTWFFSRQALIFARQSFEVVLSPNGKIVHEDLSPSLLKLAVVPDGFVIHNLTGIRTYIVQRLDGKGYDVRKRTPLP